MARYRLKHSFSSGELSPLMDARLDFSRYNNGCKKLRNMVVTTQGPVTRRSGTEFLYDLSSLDITPATDPQIRLIPFIFNELQSYVLIFYKAEDNRVYVVFGYRGEILDAGEVPPVECPPGTPLSPPLEPYQVITLQMPLGFDIKTFDYAQSNDEIYISQSGLRPHILKRFGEICWTSEPTAVFDNEPTEWSDDNGWPERVTFHQQRLVFAANTLRRQAVWMSETNNYNNFGKTGTELVDSDGFAFTLDSGSQNRIAWLLSGRALNIGTIGSEWTVVGATQSAITATNILAQRQTNIGSEPLTPLMIGATVMFLERYGRSINEFVYDFNTDSYKTSDMAILSKHVTDDFSITDWAHQQTPDAIIWSVRADGALLGTTYQRQHEVIGWHVHNTDGLFEAITSIPGVSREDEVWLAVKREINGETKHYIEKLADQFKGTLSEEGEFLDSFHHFNFFGQVTHNGEGVVHTADLVTADVTYLEPEETLIGLDHLEGKEVHILADGTVHEPLVVENGSITLSRAFGSIVVGLPYVSEVWPTLGDVETNEGTSMGRVQRITSIVADFFKTGGIWYGRHDSEDGEKEEYAPFRVPSDCTNVAVPLYTGAYHIDFPEGFDRDSNYFIRQKQPLPLTVRAVVDNIEVHNG